MKPKVNDNEGRTIGVREANKIKQCATKSSATMQQLLQNPMR